jgi:hypothetical protein
VCRYDHHKVYNQKSDGRENFFGPSSRIKLAGNAVAEKQQAAAAKYALHKEEEAAKAKAEEAKEKEANDRKEARRMAKAEKKRAAAEAAAEEADRAALGADYAKMLEVRACFIMSYKDEDIYRYEKKRNWYVLTSFFCS